MKQDRYFGETVKLSDPANEAVAITPGTPLDDTSRGLYVGVPGDAWLKLGDMDEFILFRDLANGEHPLRVKAVRVNGTTAEDLLALY